MRPAPIYTTCNLIGEALLTEKTVATYPELIEGQACQLIDRGRADGWQNITVIAPGVKKAMRRYSFGWHISKQRLNFGNPRGELRRRHPELMKWLEEICPVLWGNR